MILPINAKVSALIDEENGTWKILLSERFSWNMKLNPFEHPIKYITTYRKTGKGSNEKWKILHEECESPS